MTRNRSLPFILAALAIGCGHAQKTKDVVWPPPPEVARVKFAFSFAADADLDTSGWAAFTRFLFGDKGIALTHPMGLAVSRDGQRLYIADFEGHQVLLADFKKKSLDRFSRQEYFAAPFNVALDEDENVYVADSALRRVLVFNKTGERLLVFGKELVRPTGLALDQKRKILYVADPANVESQEHRVRAYSLDGKYLRDVGGGRGPAEGQFHFPVYLALDGAGNLYVADTMNFRVQVFDPEGRVIQTHGEAGVGVGAFSRMKGMAFDGFGNLYVVDADASVVQMFNPKFEPLMYFGGYVPLVEYLQSPTCIAIDPRNNRIYVCNVQYARINVYDLVNTKAGDSVAPAERPAPPK